MSLIITWFFFSLGSRVKLVGAGRTDAGVHAHGQAFHFDLRSHEFTSLDKVETEIEIDTIQNNSGDDEEVACRRNRDDELAVFFINLEKSLNSMLRRDVRVWNLGKAPPHMETTAQKDDKGNILSAKAYKWNAIVHAKKKLYCYRLCVPPHTITMNPMHRFTRMHVPENIDIEYLRFILSQYVGAHDFRAFAGQIEVNERKNGYEKDTKNTVRTVYSIDLVDEGCGNYRIDILLQGALYKMVRNMVGTALEVCKGRMDEKQLLQLLHNNSDQDTGSGEQKVSEKLTRKDNRARPADPQALTLEMVFYEDEYF